MSATFNIDLFRNYFSKASIDNIEVTESYVGTEEAYQEEERLRRLKYEKEWGGCSKDVWDKLAAT